ncbi:response regulator [Myxococcus sp. K15C18031901]|uniref:response regulator n=1 Tax=Myxococcus dinghuensis TaxID=2906761 RepID=UPI0020A7C642|nr:response regulator [Myxococcus dinghuensis]MCP3099364.1 response regulator [Myxococcus dinghuensis]
MKVLLVEDDASLREGMGELISDLAEVRSVGTVTEALAALGSEPFELVVTDLRIGGGESGGRAVVEAARKRQRAVAIVSAASPEEVARALRPFIPDGILVKPFQIEDILGLVERFLEVHRLSEEVARQGQPPTGGWVERGAGVQMVSSAEEGARAWVRLARDTRWDWEVRPRGREVVQLLEGELELEGIRHVAPATFFVGAGQVPEARSATGCLAVTLGLKG